MPPLGAGSPPVPVPRWASPPPGNANAGLARAARIQPLARGFRSLFRCPAGQAPRRATPTQVQPAPLGFSPLYAGFAPCSGAPLGKPPPGNANAGSARVARVQPRGCKGRSPLHKKTKNLPLPRRGRGWGDRGRKTLIQQENPASKTAVPPLVWASLPVPVPRWASPPPGNANAGSARAARIQPRGCKGRSPLHEITLDSPFPFGEERSASAVGGMGGRKAAKVKKGRQPNPPPPTKKQATPNYLRKRGIALWIRS